MAGVPCSHCTVFSPITCTVVSFSLLIALGPYSDMDAWPASQPASQLTLSPPQAPSDIHQAFFDVLLCFEGMLVFEWCCVLVARYNDFPAPLQDPSHS